MPAILFICTGNYYRSRHAEIYFNWHASARQIPWSASSRGLGLLPANNVGPLSRHTQQRLEQLAIPLPDPLPYPTDLTEEALASAQRVIALKESEHRPLMEKRFPGWVDRIEYWHVHDLDCAEPREALPQVELLVEGLLTNMG